MFGRRDLSLATETAPPLDTPAFQRALAEALVVPETLELLARDPHGFGERFELSPQQVHAITSAGIDLITEFAHDLVNKRFSLLERFSPALLGLLSQLTWLPAIARAFIREHPSRSITEQPHKVVRDCRWFHDFVETWVRAQGKRSAYLAPVLQFERAQAKLLSDDDAAAAARACQEQIAALPFDQVDLPNLYPTLGRHLDIVTFEFDVVAIVRCISSGAPLPETPPGPGATLLIAREPGRRSIRYVRLNERTRWLIARCNGSETVAELMFAFRREWDPSLTDAALIDGVWGVLSAMLTLEVLSFSTQPSGS